MSKQHQIILSIGSNQGDRLLQIERCIANIHQNIGRVVKVSKLYETPAWGFQSHPFYNCALIIHTHFSAQKILQKILRLEREMGRERHDDVSYQARTIDIDIIGFDEEVIETATLIVPHPYMHKRMFVLRPMLDLDLDWVHPKLKLNISELVLNAEDKSICKQIKNLQNPSENLGLSAMNYIAIEGNIGAGKTTLAEMIASDFNAKLVLERFADNPFLPKFYKDPQRFAFPLEMSFLADRFQQLNDDLSQFDLFKDFIVADYHIVKSMIFAKVTLADDEFKLYKTMFDIIHKEVPKPDLYVYLYQNNERLIANIKKRGRSYEKDISAQYLEKINQGYLDFIKSHKNLNTLIIDVSELDFVKSHQDYLYIVEKISKSYLSD
jgi:deoxyguanosine kinase